ncbi:DEAD/DEAH box helicase [Phaeospirillum tilakii]|uniref:DEAD/DEAH box helicase n=1 Tax=Phaeospirillum tilakii TaxID=741673 RepID=A0ABW5CBC0_9PROT
MDLLSPDHPLARALAERAYTDLTAVQSAVLAPEATGRDLLVSAQTGSGKTVAYGLALGGTLLGAAATLPPAGAPLALVVAPTRELALQVHRELSWLYRPAGGIVTSCVGGMDPRAEQRRLAQGAHIVVGTPGRLRDHLERGALDVTALRAVVLDEADEMLDMGFREDLEAILDATPAERRTLLFSATLPKEIVGLARRYQREAVRIALAAGSQGHADIEHRAVRIAPTETEHAVVNLLRYHDSPTAMVFCGTREAVSHLQASLLERGFGVVALSGELSQSERNRALQALRDGRARVCVATDVAARGIDLPSLDLVIHAELPRTAETLQHRSGRTGRAGRKGISVLLVPLSRRRRADLLIQSAGIQVAWGAVPSADDIHALDQQRLLAAPFLSEEPAEEERAMAQALIEAHPAEAIAAALARLYRSALPAAEEVFDPGPDLPARGRREGRPPREDSSERPMVWFRLNIGRLKNGDPRWLLPLICRQGRVAKQDIGAIRILERETRFEVDARVADRFRAALKQVQHPEGKIEPLADAPAPGPRERAPRERPQGERPQGERSSAERPQRERPQRERPPRRRPPGSGPQS